MQLSFPLIFFFPTIHWYAFIYQRPSWQYLTCVPLFYIHIFNNVMYHLMSGHLNGMSLHWKEALVLDTFVSGLSLYLCLLHIYVCIMYVYVCVEARGWFLFIYLTILLFIDWDIIFHLNSRIINLTILAIWVWYEILVSAFTIINMELEAAIYTLSTFMWVMGI